MATAVKEQLAMDEHVITDPAIEAALEARQKAKDSLGAVRKRFDEADEKADAEIAKLELPEGGAVRLGRFRITRRAIPAAAISFERKPASRVQITLIGE